MSNDIITSKKLTSEKWSLIEKPLSSFDKVRNQMIFDLGGLITKEHYCISTNLTTIGEYYYLIVREQICENKSLKNSKNSEQSINCLNLKPIDCNSSKFMENLKINSKNKYILQNCKKLIDTQLTLLKKQLDDNVYNKLFSDLMIEHDYIEFRILILIKILEHYSKTRSLAVDEKEEIIIGSKKILHLLKQIKNENNYNYFNKICDVTGLEIVLSEHLINDLEYMLNKVTDKYNVKIFDIANKKPKLIFDTKYDITIPAIKIQPHDSQINLMNNIKNNYDNGFLILYKTLTGLGKTTMILSICNFVRNSNKKNPVLFCCSDTLGSVRIQVLKNAFNFGIKFAMVTTINENECKITKSYNCHKNNDLIELFVCDYISTSILLKKKEHDYLLFFDEPTIMTDKINNNEVLHYLAKILYYLPKNSILCSATLPQTYELNNIVEHYKRNHIDGNVSEIISNKTLMGCVIKDFDNNIISPHDNCKNGQDLKILIDKIKKFPLLGKFYTLPYLINLNEYMKKFNMNIDLEKIESFNQENILENILCLLYKISDFDEKCFDEFQQYKNIDVVEDVINDGKLDEDFDKIIPSKLLTTHAFKYIGCCLIVSKSPMDYVRTHFYPIVEKLKIKLKMENINNKYKKYLNEMEKFMEKLNNAENSKNNMKPKEKNEEGDKINLEQEKKEMLEHLALNKPKFDFPIALDVNTEEHIKNFAKYVKHYDKGTIKNCVPHENIDITKFNVDDNLKFLLYMGVGVYCENDENYNNQIDEMLNNQQLAFIIADYTFYYGANYKITRIIINDDACDAYSINTVLQIIGRTSRMGKSYVGKVYLDANTKKRIQHFFSDPNNNTMEGTNISNAFNDFLKYIEEQKITENKKITDEQNVKLTQSNKTCGISVVKQNLNNVVDKQNNINKSINMPINESINTQINETKKNIWNFDVDNFKFKSTISETISVNNTTNTNIQIDEKEKTNTNTNTNTNVNTNTNDVNTNNNSDINKWKPTKKKHFLLDNENNTNIKTNNIMSDINVNVTNSIINTYSAQIDNKDNDFLNKWKNLKTEKNVIKPIENVVKSSENVVKSPVENTKINNAKSESAKQPNINTNINKNIDTNKNIKINNNNNTNSFLDKWKNLKK